MSNALPPAFQQRMQQQLGKSWKLFEASLKQPSPVSIRLNPAKHVKIDTNDHIPWSSEGIYLAERPVFTLDPLLHGGAYYVQEASSMFLEWALQKTIDLHEPIRVLDLCAAPGGKSTLIASLLSQESLLVSNEVIRSRASILTENIQKWGKDNIVVTNNDPEDFQALEGFFDVIVVDAPCSGEGLFRKDPDAMKEWSEDNINLCSKRQQRIVSDVWSSLKENGVMIYSTCTYNAAENEDNLKWLASTHEVEFLELPVDSSWGIEVVKKDGIIGYRFYPHRVKGEGFFLSAVRKKEAQEEIKVKISKSSFAPPSKKLSTILEHWVISPSTKTFIQRDEVVQFFPRVQGEAIELLAKNLKLVSAGTFMATVKHEKLIPEHALALSTELNLEQFQKIEMNLDDALKYLRKETLPTTGSALGFSLITYQHLPLGWVNVLSNRINNLYPSEWRIRM